MPTTEVAYGSSAAVATRLYKFSESKLRSTFQYRRGVDQMGRPEADEARRAEMPSAKMPAAEVPSAKMPEAEKKEEGKKKEERGRKNMGGFAFLGAAL